MNESTILLQQKELVRKKGKVAPLYRQIQHHLKSQVASQAIKPGYRLPTINEMMAKWKVGYQTIKSALDGLERDGLIKCEPGRGKGPIVLSSNPIEKKLSLAFVRWNSSPIFCHISDGIRAFTDEKGLEFIILDACGNPETFVEAISNPRAKINGLIIYPFDTKECYDAIITSQKRGITIVCIDRILGDIPVSSISADHYHGALRATVHLLEAHGLPVHYLGHTRSPSSCKQRYLGWIDAMRTYNYDDIDFYVHEIPFAESDSMVNTQDLNDEVITKFCEDFFQKEKQSQYSILAMNDYVAKSVYIAAKSQGLKIGEDVFVVGFGDLPLCEKLEVPLTSVAQADFRVGYEAASMLYHDFISSQVVPVHHVIPVELCARASSKV
jgi:DNA-binding LacI/PurR family transcriptional regulator